MPNCPKEAIRCRVAVAIGAALVLGAAPLHAQENCARLLAEAADAFNTGRFEDVIQRTGACLSDGKPSSAEREAIYLLRTNVFLATDELQQAETSAASLLAVNPEFTPAVTEPERFRSLVARIKRELATDAVSSVSKMSESLLEAPATVVVLTAEQIERRGYQDLEAVLHDLPGFDFSRTNGQSYSNIYQRGYRSDATNRTLVLVDGIEQNDLFSNIAYVSRQYPLSNIDRVEVVYGPASTMYGANAFLGVINVITLDPDRFLGDGKSVGGDLRAGGGSWGTTSFDGTLAGRYRGATFSLTGRVFKSDEWDLSHYSQWNYVYDAARYETKFQRFQWFLPDVISRAQALDRGALRSLNGRPVTYSDLTEDWMVSGKLKVRDFMFGMQLWQTREGTASSSTKWAQPGARNGSVWVPSQAAMYARYATALPGNLRLTYFGQAKVHELEPESSEFLLQNYAVGPFDLLDLATGAQPHWAQTRLAQSSNQVRNELNLVSHPRADLDMIAGVDLRYSSVQTDYSKSSNCTFEDRRLPKDDDLEFNLLLTRYGLFLELEPARARCTQTVGSGASVAAPTSGGEHLAVRELGIFGQASYRPARDLKLVAGWRVDNGHVSLGRGYGTVATPRFGVVYSPRNLVFKAVYAEAFKDPAYLERFSTIPGVRGIAPPLKPERVRNLEVGAGRQSAAVSADVSVYRASYTNVIGVAEQNLYQVLNSESYGMFSDRFAEQWFLTNCELVRCLLNVLTQNPLAFTALEKFLFDPVVSLNYDNLATLNVRGLQANAAWRRGGMELFGNYTYAHPPSVSAGTGRVPVGGIARNRATVGFAAGLGKFDGTIRVNLVGERSATAVHSSGVLDFLESQPNRLLFDTPPRRVSSESIDPHVVGNVSLRYQIHPRLSLQFLVNNVFNTSYADPGIQNADDVLFASQVPQPPRSMFVRLLTRF